MDKIALWSSDLWNFTNTSSAENQKTMFPLRTRRALSPQTLYSDSPLLVLNWTCLNALTPFWLSTDYIVKLCLPLVCNRFSHFCVLFFNIVHHKCNFILLPAEFIPMESIKPELTFYCWTWSNQLYPPILYYGLTWSEKYCVNPLFLLWANS